MVTARVASGVLRELGPKCKSLLPAAIIKPDQAVNSGADLAEDIKVGAKMAAIVAERSDADVIQAVLQGDINRYGELVERYQLSAWKLAYSFLGNMEDAKDLSQNCFVKAYRHLRAFGGRAKFSTWLYRIIANECKDVLRRRARQPDMLRVDAAVAGPDGEAPLFDVAAPTDTRKMVADKEMGQRLAHAIRRLPMKQQSAFVLHHVNGLPVEEVADVMNCSMGTIKVHLFRASETLRIALEDYLTREDL